MEPLQIGVFSVAATPPLGSPVAYALTRKIEDPLSARGVVLLNAGKPVVLCAVDWIGIGNAGNEVWREELAQAAGTTADRVAVHTLHPHDGPRCDFAAEELLAAQGLGGKFFDMAFCRETIQRAAQAVREAVRSRRKVTHLGVGKARVEKVASNRRILGPDGKVKHTRWSSCRDPELIAAPEGTIDPFVRLVSFWDQDKPLAVLSYYATHPQSYYGKGDVTPDFVGIARMMRDAALPQLLHVHFNGAGGNVAAGKYNDGSPERRPILAKRLADGMESAWKATTRAPIAASDVEWRSRPVALPVAKHLHADELMALLADGQADRNKRLNAASGLAWLRRATDGPPIVLGCLRMGSVYVLHMPGELFVEYQLASQDMRPNDTVCMAAYGDYGPSYIGNAIAYGQGGYEDRASLVAPEVEEVLMNAMRELLR